MNFKYQNKTEIIEAFQLTYEIAKSKEPVPVFAVEAQKNGNLEVHVTDKLHGSQYAIIETAEGKREVNAYDWIVSDTDGNLSTCTNEVFNNLYEQAE